MNRKISLGMAVTIVILAMTVTFSITMLLAMRLFDSTVSSVKEKESMYNKLAEVDRYVRGNDYYDIDETVLYDRLSAGYLLGTGDKYARYYTASAYTDLINCPERHPAGHWCGAGHRPVRLCQGHQGVYGFSRPGSRDQSGRLHHRCGWQ